MGVGQAGVARVVEMQAQDGVGRGGPGGLDLARHGPGIARADGVGQGDFLHAQFGYPADQIGDLPGRDLAVERAAPDAGQGGGQGRRRPRLTRGVGAARDDIGQHLHLLIDRQALVLQPEPVGGGHGHIDLVHGRAQRAVIALAVQHQTDAAAAGLGGQRRHDLFGPGHLRHVFRMDEADGLDPARPRGLQLLHQFGAHRRFKDSLLVLQPIARTDLDDSDRSAHRDGSAAGPPGGA